MRRPRFRRSPSSRVRTPEYSSEDIPESPSEMSLRSRDTGFPEGFCGSRNTTLPHPEANLSPNASITEDDVNPMRALTRHRMSFMAQQERGRKLSTASSEEGTLSAFSRIAINSLRNGELPSFAEIDALLSSSKDGDSIHSSDGMSSRSPDSPTQPAGVFEPATKTDPRDESMSRDPRDRRRKHRRKGSGFVSRLMHR